MAVQKNAILVLFFAVATSNFAVSANVTINANIHIPQTISNILRLPIKFIESLPSRIYRIGLKFPIHIASNIANLTKNVVNQLTNIDSAILGQVIGFIKHVVGKIVQTLVDVGVLQGKTTGDVINLIMNVIKKIITFFVKLEIQISTFIVNIVTGILEVIKTNRINRNIFNLPVVRDVRQFVLNIRDFILKNCQQQINELRAFFKTLYDQHKNFFQPIINGISSRFLIAVNALHALVDGKISECPGMDGPDQAPIGSLRRRVNIWIDRLKIAIERVIGWKNQADSDQAKLDEWKNLPPPTTNAANGSVPVGPIVPSEAPASIVTQATIGGGGSFGFGGIGGSIIGSNATVNLAGR